ncbi:MAG: diacylglycerol kinase family protein [Chloroflexota bacterium]|nr:diacylglycerol kinase family protein [Chloroflexota bacterium]
MIAKIILNPYANRWKAAERRPELETALKAAKLEYELVVSEHIGHAIELANHARQEGFSPIIAAGGDSTYNEVANGILQNPNAQEMPHFGILPMGTANDLADNLNIPKDLSKAIQVITSGHIRQLDVLQVNQRYFLNNSGIGLESVVSVIQSEMKHLHGIFRYLAAALVAIARNPQWEMDLEWDEGQYSGPVTIVSVGNNPRTGGVFYTVPHASPFNGKLTFVYGSVETRPKILRLLPKIMKPVGKGNYVNHPSISEIETTNLSIQVRPSTPLHVDGEIISKAIQKLTYSVHPARLPMLVPPQ